MREILFRGQFRKYGEKFSVGTGEKLPSIWAYGGIFSGTGDFSIIYGWNDSEEQTGSNLKKIPVYSDTVGQFTSLTDKNGVKIFEGDIVRITLPLPSQDPIVELSSVDFDNGCFMVTWGGSRATFDSFVSDTNFEVIGNIHDNSEILEVKE